MGIMAMKFDTARVGLFSNVFGATVAVVLLKLPNHVISYVLVAFVLVLVFKRYLSALCLILLVPYIEI